MNQHLPGSLLQSLKEVEGFDENAFVAAHESSAQVVSIRINPKKIHHGSPQLFPDREPVPWNQYGFYLPLRPIFTFDPLIHAGAYYVQEPSSMFIEQCVKQLANLSSPLKVLDLCAAPGGKSTLLLSLLNEKSLLVSNEVIKTRVSVLVENLSKWGAPNVIVTNNDPRDFSRLKNFFDVLVVDAPCSGSGLFRKDAAAIEEWSEEAVTSCSLRQKRILADAYDCLQENGLLIYSTCSYSVEENENICDWLMDEYSLEPLSLQVEPDWKIVATSSNKHRAAGYRFFPDKTRGEGFFVACFQKKEGAPENDNRYKKGNMQSVASKDRALVSKWLKLPDDFQYYLMGNEIFVFPYLLADDLAIVHGNLYIKKAGVPVGKMVRDELIPAHELAVSTIVNENLSIVSLNKEEALQYLRKEEVTIDTKARGWSLVRYHGINLGWVKILANRWNNYYPKEWRILKSGSN